MRNSQRGSTSPPVTRVDGSRKSRLNTATCWWEAAHPQAAPVQVETALKWQQSQRIGRDSPWNVSYVTLNLYWVQPNHKSHPRRLLKSTGTRLFKAFYPMVHHWFALTQTGPSLSVGPTIRRSHFYSRMSKQANPRKDPAGTHLVKSWDCKMHHNSVSNYCRSQNKMCLTVMCWNTMWKTGGHVLHCGTVYSVCVVHLVLYIPFIAQGPILQ